MLVRLWRGIEPRPVRLCVKFWCQGPLSRSKVVVAHTHRFFRTRHRGKCPVENDQVYKSSVTYFTRSDLSQCLPHLSCSFTSSRVSCKSRYRLRQNLWRKFWRKLAHVGWSGLRLCSSHLPLPAASDAGDHHGGHGRLGGHEVDPTDAPPAIRVSICSCGAVEMASPGAAVGGLSGPLQRAVSARDRNERHDRHGGILCPTSTK